MRLWLARHARTQAPAGVCYGRTDLPADAAATQLAAMALAQVLPQGVQVVVSPLRRCVQLAQALQALRADCCFDVDPRLAEMDFGQWEGRRWDDIGPQAMAAWTDDFAAHRPGGGESVHDFMARVAQAFDARLLVQRDVAWITHAGVIRAAALISQGVRRIDDPAQWPAEAPAFGSYTIVTCAAVTQA